MLQVTYSSLADDGLGSEDVFGIIETSTRNNGAAGLTGFLIFSDHRFFQVVEGPEAAIEDLLRRLEADERHHSITILNRREIDESTFPRWRMKRFAPSANARTLADLGPDFADAPQHVKQAAEHFLAHTAAA
jgi:hypothetical protein